MMKMLRCMALAVLCLAAGSWKGDVAAQNARALTVDDLFRIKRVQDPRVSPDGIWVAYTVRTTSLESEKTETRVWMVQLSGGDPIPMTALGSSASEPRWSPDGKYLSFLAARNDEKTQVWTLNRQGGEAQQLTDIDQGVSSYEWSPDATRLVLTLRDPGPEDAKADDEKPKTRDPWVIDRLQFKRDNVGYLDNRRTHLFVFDIATRSLTQLTDGPYDDSSPVWSPDGSSLAFVSNRTGDADANSNTDIWIVSSDHADSIQEPLRVTSNAGADFAPAWSPDGSLLTYVTVTQPELIWYAIDQLAVASADGRSNRILSAGLDRNVRAPRFAPDGTSIYFQLEDSGERHLARVALSGENLSRPIAGSRRVSAFDLTDGGSAVALISEPHLPGEIFVQDGSGLRQLTETNDSLMATLTLAAVRNVQFLSADGTEIEGFIYTPPDFETGLRYPTLLRIHGGPVSQYDFAFNFEAQLFAANGYVVVMSNPRGSSGYGQDFSLGIYRDWGNKDFEDVMAGVDFAITQGYADPERLGVGGWSYGGILTNYVITKTDRFAAAITGASEVLYVTNYGHDHYQLQWEQEMGLPWENRELWERLSPFNQVEKIVTPTLIMGGEKDWNVPIINSEQLYQALRRLGRTTQLVVYPGEHHGIRAPSYQKDRLERYLVWYDRFVKREQPD